MSVTFYSDVEDFWKNKSNYCYCVEHNRSISRELYNKVQDAASKIVLYDENPLKYKDILEEAANKSCTTCNGKGICASREYSPTININWSNSNAAVIFDLLDIDMHSDESIPISRMRQKIFRALNKDISGHERPEEIEYGKPREIEPGVVNLKPLRYFDRGLDRTDIMNRLKLLSEFVIDASNHGGKVIYWG